MAKVLQFSLNPLFVLPNGGVLRYELPYKRTPITDFYLTEDRKSVRNWNPKGKKENQIRVNCWSSRTSTNALVLDFDRHTGFDSFEGLHDYLQARLGHTMHIFYSLSGKPKALLVVSSNMQLKLTLNTAKSTIRSVLNDETLYSNLDLSPVALKQCFLNKDNLSALASKLSKLPVIPLVEDLQSPPRFHTYRYYTGALPKALLCHIETKRGRPFKIKESHPIAALLAKSPVGGLYIDAPIPNIYKSLGTGGENYNIDQYNIHMAASDCWDGFNPTGSCLPINVNSSYSVDNTQYLLDTGEPGIEPGGRDSLALERGRLKRDLQRGVAVREGLMRVLLATPELREAFDLPTTELAAYLNTTPKTISLELKRLAREGLLTVVDHKYRVGVKAKTYKACNILLRVLRASYGFVCDLVDKTLKVILPESIKSGEWHRELWRASFGFKAAAEFKAWAKKLWGSNLRKRRQKIDDIIIKRWEREPVDID